LDISNFHHARLIPTVGIRGEQEQEGRTTSALLAVMVAVPDFARVLLKALGAPAGRAQTFVEPEFLIGERKVRPDGLILLERGGKTWTALVEVKTGRNPLKLEQINDYLEVCRLNNIDALLTISNQVLTHSGEHPVAGIDGRKLKKTRLIHYSWVRILTEALMLKEHKGIADVDQEWLIGELIRYLQHPASGAAEFNDMGPGWTEVLKGIATGTLKSTDAKVSQTVQSFESLTRYLAFRLSVKLGVNVREIIPKSAVADPKKHNLSVASDFIKTGVLKGGLRIPNTASDLTLTADLRAGIVSSSVDIPAPQDGRSLTRVNWLLRQLSGAPDSLKIETRVKRASSQQSTAVMLADALAKPTLLVPVGSAEISGFRLTLMGKLGTKHGNGAGSFIFSATESVELGYQFMLQGIKVWLAKAPRLSREDSVPEDSPFDPEASDSLDLGDEISTDELEVGNTSELSTE
jgi:hypothetical protein